LNFHIISAANNICLLKRSRDAQLVTGAAISREIGGPPGNKRKR